MMKIEIDSPTWQAIKKHISNKVDTHIARLKTQGTNERESNFLRGYMAALEDLTALATEPQTEPKKPLTQYR
jgi:hypothetical protein